MKNISIILFFFLLVSFSEAQVDSVRLNKQYLTHYYTDTRDWITAPVKWKGKDWLKLAAFTGTTVTLTAIDQPVNDFFQKHQKEAISSVSKYGFEPLGNIYAYAAMAGFLAHGYFSGNNRSRSTGLLAIESYIVSGLLVRIPKYGFGRSRPDVWWGPGPYEWKGPINGKSFPSGHTTSAFAVASVIAYQYKDKPWVPITAYSLASLAGISRVYDNRHWLSDVFAGAIFGTVTGRFICRQHQHSQFLLEPVSIDGISGVKMVYRW
jgi:hypothetical protein